MFNKRFSVLFAMILFMIVSPLFGMMQDDNIQNNKEVKSFLSEYVLDGIEGSMYGIGIGLLINSIIAVSLKTNLMKSSYEYIKEMPVPIQLLSVGGSMTLIGTIMSIRRKLNEHEQKLTIIDEVLSQTLNTGSMHARELLQLKRLMSQEQSERAEEANEFKGALINNALALDVLNNNQLEIIMSMNNRMNDLEEQQKKAAPLVAIFQELQQDIRYREKVVQAEKVENNRCNHNRLNLGGVE